MSAILKHAKGQTIEVPEESVDYYLEKGWKPAAEVEQAGAPSEEWTVDELKAHAEAAAIDLGSAKVKKDILAAIAAAGE